MTCKDIKNMESIDFNNKLASTEDKSDHSDIFSNEMTTYGNSSTKSFIASYRWTHSVAHKRFKVLIFDSKSNCC